MTEKVDYRGIVERLWFHGTDTLNEWEMEFLDNMTNWKNEYTEKQKETILKINSKFLKRNNI